MLQLNNFWLRGTPVTFGPFRGLAVRQAGSRRGVEKASMGHFWLCILRASNLGLLNFPFQHVARGKKKCAYSGASSLTSERYKSFYRPRVGLPDRIVCCHREVDVDERAKAEVSFKIWTRVTLDARWTATRTCIRVFLSM